MLLTDRNFNTTFDRGIQIGNSIQSLATLFRRIEA